MANFFRKPKLSLTDLITWKGQLSRLPFVIWGVLLLAIKYNLDRLVAKTFGKVWFITDYYAIPDRISLLTVPEDLQSFYWTLGLTALPFIWFGLMLCMKRLSGAGLPRWLAAAFFIPLLNLLLFTLLALLPDKGEESSTAGNKLLDRLLPHSVIGTQLAGVVLGAGLPLLFGVFFTRVLENYGWGLFVGVPFFMGFIPVLIANYRRNSRTVNFSEAIVLALGSVGLFCVLAFFTAVEGMICLIMAFPILFLVALAGAAVAFAMGGSATPKASAQMLLAPMLVVLGSGLVEDTEQHTPPQVAVRTAVVVNAPRQAVWNELVAFSHIDEPTDWLFKTGIAYPTHAEIEGHGVGAIRHCNFTTGAFVEPIHVWDEPNRLAFGVLDQPPPMVEWSIYDKVEMAHIDGYFKSEKGQFLLTTLPDGSTRLEGTTWYRHNVWPVGYWRLWSDFILHRIHLRVLNHIKAEAEG